MRTLLRSLALRSTPCLTRRRLETLRCPIRSIVVSAMVLGTAASGLTAQTEGKAPEAPALSIEAVHVTPDALGPDQLCQLAVEIENRGSKIASQLGFEVRLAGTEVPVYRNQIFMDSLPPGETTRVDLYNFWSTETARPAPKGKAYSVEVTLTEAKWYQIEDVEEEGDTIEEWTPLDPVPQLPQSARVSLPWSAATKP